MPSTVTLLLYLDTERPLSEPKWARTGDVQEWLRSMFGRMFWVAGDAAEGWEKKIHVVDPDPVSVHHVGPEDFDELLILFFIVPAPNYLDSP